MDDFSIFLPMQNAAASLLFGYGVKNCRTQWRAEDEGNFEETCEQQAIYDVDMITELETK